MIDWNQGGITGSVKRWAAQEVNRHIRTNKTIRNARYSISLRCLRLFMADRPFAWFVVLYVSIDLFLVFIEILLVSVAPGLRPSLVPPDPELRGFLKDAASYFITAQVGALGIVSIAVGLVTLIAQRQNAGIDVQIYYH